MATHYTEILEFDKGSASAEFQRWVKKLLEKIDRTPMGEKLLKEIASKSRDNSVAGVLLSTPFKFEGLGRSFGWDDRSRTFKLDPEYFNYPENKGTNKIEPTQEEVIKRDMIYVYLFYELAHFYHYVSGRWSYHIGINEESNATGLYEFTNVEYSENAFRKQLQLKRRPCYAFRTGIMKWPGSPEYYEDERKKRATRGLPEQKLITLESEECQHGYNWNKETFPVGPARLAGPIRHIPARSHPRRRP